MNTAAYPSLIAQACSAIDESLLFKDLPDGYIRVVVRIIKKINISRLNAPIFASRTTLATESGKSVETVGRVVKWLEDRGLVQRDQKAMPGLRGSRSPLIPTQKLLEALLLTGRDPAVSNNKGRTNSPAVCPDVSVSFNQSNPSENNPRRGQFLTIDKVKIPSDLAWMIHKNGLRATAVLLLMKQAKQANKRLSDIVAATIDYLTPLRSNQLFAYVKALIGKDRDFAQQAKSENDSRQKQADRERLERKADELRGRRFHSRDGSTLVIVEANGIIREVAQGKSACYRFSQRFLDAIDSGSLRPERSSGDGDE
jgi:hypothetical protein